MKSSGIYGNVVSIVKGPLLKKEWLKWLCTWIVILYVQRGLKGLYAFNNSFWCAFHRNSESTIRTQAAQHSQPPVQLRPFWTRGRTNHLTLLPSLLSVLYLFVVICGIVCLPLFLLYVYLYKEYIYIYIQVVYLWHQCCHIHTCSDTSTVIMFFSSNVC